MKRITQEWLNRAKDDLDVVQEIITIAIFCRYWLK